MSVLGAGAGSGYPTAIDTRQTFTNGVNPLPDDSTRIDSEAMNDALDAIVKLQTELGINPSDAADDSITPADAAATVLVKLNMILTRLKEIISGTDWKDAVSVTLNALAAHRARHIAGGADAFLSTDLIEAIVKRIQESGGPTTLAIGSIPDGQFVQRSGASLIGVPGTVIAGVTGLETSNNGVDPTNDIDVAVGAAISDDAVVTNRAILNLVTAITGGQLDATWVAGSSVGKRVSGQTFADGTWHIFLFRRSAGAIDWCFSNSFTFTIPDGGDKKKWIGAALRSAGAIRLFDQRHDTWLWDVPVQDYNATNPGVSATLRALTVPTGLKVTPIHNAVLIDASAALQRFAIWTSPDQADTAPGTGVFTLVIPPSTSQMRASTMLNNIWTDTSAQIRTRLDATDANVSLQGITWGWQVDRAEVR